MTLQSDASPTRWLIFARHGRTFAPGQRPVWLGCNQDDPLSAPGVLDARALGCGLVAAGIKLAFALVSPQLRAQQTYVLASEQWAQAGHQAPAEVRVDARLSELDFGRWTGLGQDELEMRGEGDDARRWTASRIWPRAAGFAPSEPELLAQAHALVGTCRQKLLARKDPAPQAGLVVSHGARLRFVLASLVDAHGFAAPKDKLGCGQVGLWRLTIAGFRCVAWNVAPGALAPLLAAQSC